MLGENEMQYILNQYNRNISDEDLLQDMSDVAKQLNKETITMEEYNKLDKYHSSTITRRLGSWLKCLEKANLQPSRSPIKISEDDLFENIEHLWQHFGRQPK